MILEGLILFSCQKGFCEEALNSYYVQNPVFKQRFYEIKGSFEREIQPYMEPVIVRYTVPLLMFVKDRKASLDLGNKKTLTMESGDVFSLKFTFNF